MTHLVDVTMFWGPASGGVRRYLQAKRHWLAQRPGWRHTLVTPSNRLTLVAERAGTAAHVELPSLPLPGVPGYRFVWSRRRAAEALRQLGPDLIEAADPYNLGWAARDAAQALGIPAVACVHSDAAALAGRLAGRLAEAQGWRYLRHLYGGFDLVLAPSAALCARLHAAGIEAEHQPLGVDTRCFTPAARDPAWRQALGLGADQRLVLYAGRFSPEKNLPLLAEAVARLGPRYRLVLLGAGPVRVEGALVLPFVQDPRRLATALASCDVFVHAGDMETFGLAPLEAMACGTPVVLRAAGGLAELADDRVGAAVPASPARAAAEFAAAIEATCARDRDLLGAAARARACAYDWSAVLAQLAGRYRRLLGRAALHAPLPERDPATEPS